MTASTSSGLRSLPKERWIALELALSWICFDEAFDLETLRRDVLPATGLSEEAAKNEYQVAWRDLADFTSKNGFTVRGYRRHRESESRCRELSNDDLFNCRFVDFILTPRGHTILASRFDRDRHGIWQTIHDRDGSDFANILIRRDHLLAFKKRARPRLVNRKVSAVKARKALNYARTQIEGKEASEVRREDVVGGMRKIGVSREIARLNWKLATEHRSDLRLGGRRKRAE